jgi:hypothetical protein
MPFDMLLSAKDYLKTKTAKEKVSHILTPAIVAIIVVFLQYKFTRALPVEKFDYIKIINDLISSSLSVVALFISFSLACLTVLVSSSSENITKSQQDYHEKYRIDGKKVSLFQLLLIDLTYTVIIQAIFIVILFLQKFFIDFIGDRQIIILLVMNTALLLHVIILEIRNTNNIYMLFWKSR